MASGLPLLKGMKTGVYRQRNPRNTPLYQLIEDHFDEFCREYEQRFEYRDGALRPIVQETNEIPINLWKFLAQITTPCSQCRGRCSLSFIFGLYNHV